MNKKVSALGGALAIVVAAVSVTMLMGAKETIPYSSPNQGVSIQVIQDTSKANDSYISQIATLTSKFTTQIEAVNPASENLQLEKADAYWVHPNVLHTLSDEQVQNMKDHIMKGKPIIYMAKDASEFYETFGVDELVLKNHKGNTTTVGIGALYNGETYKGKEVAEYTVISVPNDRIENEGDKPGVNAFVNATNKMMNQRKSE